MSVPSGGPIQFRSTRLDLPGHARLVTAVESVRDSVGAWACAARLLGWPGLAWDHPVFDFRNQHHLYLRYPAHGVSTTSKFTTTLNSILPLSLESEIGPWPSSIARRPLSSSSDFSLHHLSLHPRPRFGFGFGPQSSCRKSSKQSRSSQPVRVRSALATISPCTAVRTTKIFSSIATQAANRNYPGLVSPLSIN